MNTQARLNAGLHVGGDDELVGAQCLSLSAPLLQEDPTGLELEG